MHQDDRDSEADSETDRDGYELEGRLEARQVSSGRARASVLLRDEREETTVRQARRQLKQNGRYLDNFKITISC